MSIDAISIGLSVIANHATIFQIFDRKYHMSDTTIAPRFVYEALERGELAGVDMLELLDSLGVQQSELGHLSAELYGKIWLELSFRMQDEFFGYGARPMRPGSFTLMVHATCHAKNLEVALGRALRFMTILIEDPSGTLAFDQQSAKLVLTENGKPKPAFAYRAYFVLLHSLNCWLAGERIPITHIQFPCAAPKITNDYQDFFGVPVVFDADHASMEFDRKFLRKSINKSEQEVKKFLQSAPTVFLSGYRHDTGLKAKIIAELSTDATDAWLSIDEIAPKLGLSVSTLQRRLKEEGQSFGEIKEERRRNLAISLLKSSSMTITEIAQRVGYAEPSAFFRAFHRWYGVTPAAIREGSHSAVQ